MTPFKRHGRNASRVTLTRTLRGDGILVLDGVETAVGYSIDQFGGMAQPHARGTLTGVFAETESGTLVLETGLRLEVTLDEHDEDGAAIEVINAEALVEHGASA